MAPTRSTRAGAKRKGETLSFSEGSNKGKEKVTEDSILFMGKKEKDAFFKDFSNREVIFGRTIDFPFFNRLGFEYEKSFTKVGWFPALMIKDVVYPTLVQHFYTNLSLENNSIHSKVKGVEIILDSIRLNSILRVKNEGVLVNNSVKKVTEGYEYVDALRHICDNSELTKDHKPSANELSLKMRVLHHILNHIIVPRKGKFEHVSYLEMYLMWAVVTGKATNLGHLMIHHMADCKKGNKFALPYGMFLTTIFKEFKVNLKGERSEEMDPNFYGEKTLRYMGYIKAQGTWVLKKAQDPHTPTPAPTTQSEPESSSGPASSSLSGEILECLKGLSAQMSSLGDRLDAMEARNAEKFEVLTARINEIEAMNEERINRLIESQRGVSCQVREVYNDMTTLKKQQRNCIRAGSERVMEMSNAVTALKASYAQIMEGHKNIHDEDLKQELHKFMIWWYQEFNRRFPNHPPQP